MLLSETEPLSLDNRDRWQMQNSLAARLIAGADITPGLRAIRTEGILPFGYPGEKILHETQMKIDPLVQRMREEITGEALPPESVILDLGRWNLSGTLNGRYPSGLIRLTAWRLNAGERLRAWIDHLVMCAAVPAGAKLTSRLFTTDLTLDIGPVPDSRQILEDLLAIYWAGLHTPVPFFLDTSFEFARRTIRPSSRETANPLSNARTLWLRYECKEPHSVLCFRGRDPLDQDWEAISIRIWKPFFLHANEAKPAI